MSIEKASISDDICARDDAGIEGQVGSVDVVTFD